MPDVLLGPGVCVEGLEGVPLGLCGEAVWQPPEESKGTLAFLGIC